MSNRLASLLSASLLACAPGAALAQGAAPPAVLAQPTSTVAPVTVEGELKPQMVEKQARAFTEAYAASSAELGQIARWRDPLCVHVVGLIRPDQGAMIKARIEDVAKAVDQRVLGPGCTANIEVVFTDKPQVLMDNVAHHRELALGYYHRHEGAKLKQVTHPIQAWYVTASAGDFGNNGAMGFTIVTGEGPPPATWSYQAHQEVVDDPDNQAPTGCGDAPHFTGCLKSVFRNILVVADTRALEGKDAGLLSDYIVMVTLAQPRSLDDCNVLPSVLDLMAKSACPGHAPPDGLTPADAAYLTALYTADPEARKWGQVTDISGRMARILIGAGVVSR